MDLHFNQSLASGYHSGSQISRVLTEVVGMLEKAGWDAMVPDTQVQWTYNAFRSKIMDIEKTKNKLKRCYSPTSTPRHGAA